MLRSRPISPGAGAACRLRRPPSGHNSEWKPNMTDLRTYVSLATDLRSGKTTPRAYLDACLERIAQREPKVGAFVNLNLEGARAAADASTARWKAARPLSAIDGMPIAIKDVIE